MNTYPKRYKWSFLLYDYTDKLIENITSLIHTECSIGSYTPCQRQVTCTPCLACIFHLKGAVSRSELLALLGRYGVTAKCTIVPNSRYID